MNADESEVARATRRAEREVFRARIRAVPADMTARAALAESYRARGNLDQAGRWGLLVSGGSTPEERRQFARHTARFGTSDLNRVRRLLLIPSGMPISEVDPAEQFGAFLDMLAEERESAEREGNAQSDGYPEGYSLGEYVFAQALFALTILALTGLYVLGALLAGADRGFLRAVGYVGLSLAGLAAIVVTLYVVVTNLSRRHARRRNAAIKNHV